MTENGMKRAYIEDSYFTSVLFIRVGLFIYLLLGILSVVGIIYYFRKRNEQKHQQAMEKFEREKERELYTAKNRFLYECGA